MGMRTLPPEVCLDLQIQLDRLLSAGERCREAVLSFADGSLSREDLIARLCEQQRAQSDWESKQRKYIRSRDA
jgi:hypothetical protein